MKRAKSRLHPHCDVVRGPSNRHVLGPCQQWDPPKSLSWTRWFDRFKPILLHIRRILEMIHFEWVAIKKIPSGSLLLYQDLASNFMYRSCGFICSKFLPLWFSNSIQSQVRCRRPKSPLGWPNQTHTSSIPLPISQLSLHPHLSLNRLHLSKYIGKRTKII